MAFGIWLIGIYRFKQLIAGQDKHSLELAICKYVDTMQDRISRETFEELVVQLEHFDARNAVTFMKLGEKFESSAVVAKVCCLDSV